MAVIVSLTFAGQVVADMQMPADPGPLVAGVVEEGKHLVDGTDPEDADLHGDEFSGIIETADQAVGGAPSSLECQIQVVRDAMPEHEQEDESGSCDEGEAPDGEPTPGGTNETGSDAADRILDVVGGLPDNADDRKDEASGVAKKEGNNLIRAIWGPLQEVSQEAGRLFQDAYGTAFEAFDHTASSVHGSISYATGTLVWLTGEAEQASDQAAAMLLDQAQGLLGTAEGALDDLLGSGGGSAQDAGAEEGMGARSTRAGASGASSTAHSMMIAGGIGLALAGLAALRRLLGLGGAALLSRIPSSQLMKNGTRNSIFEIVRTDPGVSLNEIVDRVGLSRNAVAYHLAVFESEKLMTSVKDGKYRRYFLNGGRYVNGAKDVVAAIKNDKTLHVIRFIAENPGAIQKEVCTAVGTSPSATSWHIRRLERVGLVEKERRANTVRYKPGPNLDRYDLSEFGLAGQPPQVREAPVAASA